MCAGIHLSFKMEALNPPPPADISRCARCARLNPSEKKKQKTDNKQKHADLSSGFVFFPFCFVWMNQSEWLQRGDAEAKSAFHQRSAFHLKKRRKKTHASVLSVFSYLLINPLSFWDPCVPSRRIRALGLKEEEGEKNKVKCAHHRHPPAAAQNGFRPGW